MQSFERVHIEESELNGRNETEKCLLTFQKLGEIGLDGSDLLYCGIEGRELLGENADNRLMTFAASFKKIMEAAHEIDETGSTYDCGYPFCNATTTDVEVPAIAVYDRGELVPQHPEEDSDWDWLEEWVHKDGKSVNEALKAVVFIEP